MGRKPKNAIQPLDVPFWALGHLGKSVTLATPWGPFKSGETGILDGVTHLEDGTNRALVIFDSDAVEDLTDVPFVHLQSPGLPFDLANLPGRLGEIAFLWAHGYDLRKRVCKATFYRYRKGLLAYRIDISMPPRLTAAG